MSVGNTSWLGLNGDFLNERVRITKKRINDFMVSISTIISKNRRSGIFLLVRSLAKVVGKIVSMHIVFG